MRTNLAGRSVFYGTGSVVPAPDAPAILLVHGAGFDHSVWVQPARYFARHGFHVLAPDLPGHGQSAGPALESIEAMTDWLVMLLDDAGVAQVTAVGHSMGSLVVADLAVRYRQRVSRLALLGTSDPMSVGPPLLAAAADDHAAAFAMANSWSHSPRGVLGRAASPGQNNLVSGTRWLERMLPGVYHADLKACNEFRMHSGEITQPALIIAGTEDKMTPLRAGVQLAEQLANSETITLAECGHAMLSEKPNEVVDALAAFCNPAKLKA